MSGGKLHAFPTSTLAGNEWSVSGIACFVTGRKANNHCIGRRAEIMAGLDSVEIKIYSKYVGNRTPNFQTRKVKFPFA
jgi:hypothetical protein